MRLTGLRRSTHEADVVVAGSGLPPLVTALELARRGARVIVAREDPDGAPPALGLMLQGPGRPYAAVARAISRPAAQVVWAAGCENHLRAKAFLEQAGWRCGFEARGSFLLARDRRQAEELEESEDLLRDDGFPGEFLDHFMLETRFDLSGFPAAYWAAGDAELDVRALDEALRDAVGDAGVAFATGRVRGLRPEASSVRVELETRSLTGAAAVVASDGPVAALVPELAPLVALATLARVSTAPLEGANLPTAVRTADGRMAWHSSGGAFLLAETRPARPATRTRSGSSPPGCRWRWLRRSATLPARRRRSTRSRSRSRATGYRSSGCCRVVRSPWPVGSDGCRQAWRSPPRAGSRTRCCAERTRHPTRCAPRARPGPARFERPRIESRLLRPCGSASPTT